MKLQLETRRGKRTFLSNVVAGWCFDVEQYVAHSTNGKVVRVYFKDIHPLEFNHESEAGAKNFSDHIIRIMYEQ